MTDFEPRIDPAAVADLRERLDRVRWPEQETVEDRSQGIGLAELQALVAYWRDGYDVERLGRRLASVPQVLVEVDGLGIHAIHARSPRPDAVPLLVTHGWPSSPFEFLDVIGLLTEPGGDGGQAGGPAFHVVCPSLPGYAFGAKPTGPGWGAERTADAWAELMTTLGYDGRFLAQGGDWGAIVSTQLAIRHPDRLTGLHLTMPQARVGDEDRAGASDFERRGLEREADYRRTGSAYAVAQATRPQTMGYGLVDSPVALCAWVGEKLLDWSGRDEDGRPLLDRDAVLDVVTLYWLTATGASSARMYAEALRTPYDVPVEVPTGCSIFSGEIIRPPRSAVARRFRDLRSWHEIERGGHFSASEVPQVWAREVRDFARVLADG